MNPPLRGLVCAAALLGAAMPSVALACDTSVPLTRPDSRYVVHGDGTVTDSVTGLMWKRCSEGLTTTTTACDTGIAFTYTWPEAFARAADVNAGREGENHGYDDWRIPNVKELHSLSESACVDPAINQTVFPQTPTAYDGWAWSSSPSASGEDAWAVVFLFGGTSADYKKNGNFVRLVRGGQ